MLYGLKVIAAHFGASPHVVKQWRRNGAPIRVLCASRGREGRRYQADDGALRGWLQSAD